MSFYSKSLYQDVGRNWKGISFVYLLSLLALCWIPGMVQLHSDFYDYVTNTAPDIVEQFPPVTISNGEASIDEPEPYFIKDPEYGAVMIIDTTGQFTSLNDTEARALLMKTKFIIRESETATRIFDLSQVNDFVVDQSLINGWLEILRNWLAIVIYPFAVLFSFVYRVIQALLYAAIGILMAKMMRATLSFQSLLSLAIVAITPAVLLGTVLNYMYMGGPFWNLVCFAISMGFLFYAVKANSEGEIAGPSGYVP
jgi:hypothetical protein